MAAQDFTTFTRKNVSNVTSTSIVSPWMYHASNCYMYKDMGVGAIGLEFTHYLRTSFELSATGDPHDCLVWGVSNVLSNYFFDNGNQDRACVEWVASQASYGSLTLYCGGPGAGTTASVNNLSSNTAYYLSITRTTSTIRLRVFTDALRTNIVGDVSVTNAGVGSNTFRYMWALSNWIFALMTNTIRIGVYDLDLSPHIVNTFNATLLTTTASTIPVGKKIVPRSCPPLEVDQYYKYAMTSGNGFTIGQNSIQCTNVTSASRHWAFTYHTSAVGTWQGHFTMPTFGGIGTGTVWLYPFKLADNTTPENYICLYYGRVSGALAVGVARRDNGVLTTLGQWGSPPSELWWSVNCSPAFVYTITFYSDAARTTVWKTVTFTKVQNYRYFYLYDDGGAAVNCTWSTTMDQLRSVGDYPLVIQAQSYWSNYYRYTPTIKLIKNATTLSRPVLTYAPLVRKMETPFATSRTYAPRPQLRKQVSGLVASPSILFGMQNFLPLYTKDDATSNLTIAEHAVSGTAVRSTTSQLWRDAGVGSIGNFDLTFSAMAVGNPINGAIAPMIIGNTTANSATQSGGLQAIRPSIYGANNKWYLHLVAPNVGAAVAQEITKDTTYYARVVRTGSVLSLAVFSDASMTTQVGTTQTTTCQPTLTFRYFFPFNAYSDGTANVNFNFAFGDVLVTLPPKLNLTPLATTLSTVSSLIAPTYTTGGTVSPSLFQLIASVIAPRIFASIRVEPSVVSAVSSVIAPRLQLRRYQGTLLASAILYQPEFGGSVEVNAPLLTATVVQYTPTFTTGSDVQPPVFNLGSTLFASSIQFQLNETCLSRPAIVYPPNYIQKQRLRPNCLFLTSGLVRPSIVFTLHRTCFEVTSYTPLNHVMGFTIHAGLESVGSIISPVPVFDVTLSTVNAAASVINPTIQVTQHGTILPQLLTAPVVLYASQINLRPVMTEVNTVSGVVRPAIQVSKGVSLVSVASGVITPVPAIAKTVGLVSAQAGLVAPVIVSGGDVSVSTLPVASSIITPLILITLNPNTLTVNAHVDNPSMNRVINVNTLNLVASVNVPTIYNGWVISLGDALNVASAVVSPTVLLDRSVELLSGSCAMPHLDIEFGLHPLNLTCPVVLYNPGIRAGGRTVFADTFIIVVSQPDEGILIEKTLVPLSVHARFEGLEWESGVAGGMSKQIIGRSADASRIKPNLAEWQLALAKRILSEGVWSVHLLMPELDMVKMLRVLFVAEFAESLISQLVTHEEFTIL